MNFHKYPLAFAGIVLFLPILALASEAPQTRTKKALLSNVEVESIISTPKGLGVVINGHTYYTGDEINETDGFKVHKITTTTAIFRYKGKTFYKKVYSEQDLEKRKAQEAQPASANPGNPIPIEVRTDYPFGSESAGNINLAWASTECEVDAYEIARGTTSSEHVSSLKKILNFIHTPGPSSYVVYEGQSKEPVALDEIHTLLGMKSFKDSAGMQVVNAINDLIGARRVLEANKEIQSSGNFFESIELKNYKATKKQLITALERRFGIIHRYNNGCD